MEPKHTVLFTIKTLSNQVKRFIDKRAVTVNEDLTGMQLAIIGYIEDFEKERIIFQKDIEEEFHIRSSTVTTILKKLEKEKYIERVRIPSDERYKKLSITKKSKKLYLQGKELRIKDEKTATNGLTQEEITTFLELSDKIMKNLL